MMERIKGIGRIDRVVANFAVWFNSDELTLPFPKMKVKVLEHDPGHFAAFGNVSVRDRATGYPDGEAGLGASIDEALTDMLTRFVTLVRKNTPPAGLTEEDFVWSDHEDF